MLVVDELLSDLTLGDVHLHTDHQSAAAYILDMRFLSLHLLQLADKIAAHDIGILDEMLFSMTSRTARAAVQAKWFPPNVVPRRP